jgi:hypothetical protein
VVALRKNNSLELSSSGAMSFPSASQRESMMKEKVDEEHDVVLLHLQWKSTDLGQIPKRLPLHLQLPRPVDEGRYAAFLTGRTGMYSRR